MVKNKDLSDSICVPMWEVYTSPIVSVTKILNVYLMIRKQTEKYKMYFGTFYKTTPFLVISKEVNIVKASKKEGKKERKARKGKVRRERRNRQSGLF